MITLKEVAQKCQLSVTQVSRALNNHSDVSEKTKEFVQKTAKEMGYVKNIYASNLAIQKTNQIAVIIEGLEADINEVTSSNILHLLRGINSVACNYGFDPLIYMKNRLNPLNYVDFCKQRYVSGVIVFGCDYNDPNLLALQKSHFPCVTIDSIAEGKTNGNVVVNNTFYSQQAVEHLISQDCKYIACITGFEHSLVTIERMNGYKMALMSHHLEFNEEYIRICDFDANTAQNATLDLLEKHPEIDGIFCMSDQMGIGCIEAVKKSSRKIPEEVKVFGFDGLYFCNYTAPPLSTISQNFAEKGCAAVKLLVDILEDKTTTRTVVVPCDIIIRKSSCITA